MAARGSNHHVAPAQDSLPRAAMPGRVVQFDPTGAIVPPGCACCGEPAGASRVETRPRDGATLIVPYCSACVAHASRASTHALSVTLASAVLSLSVAAALPLVWVFITPAVYALGIALAALTPFSPLLVPGRPRPPCTAHGKGAWWSSGGGLYCTRPEFAAELARVNGGRIVPARSRRAAPSAWMAAGPVLGLAVAPLAWWLTHPLVRIVDVTDSLLVIEADGHFLARVEPTQSESPAAGVEVRLPVGRRRLTAKDPSGRIIATDDVSVRPGAEHLYAPASPATCFWLETTGYGRTRPVAEERVPLDAETRFWVLPLAVDTWFSPNPPEGADSRSTGGVLTALRQAPCDEAPADVGNR
jgi:hypothetical protein